MKVNKIETLKIDQWIFSRLKLGDNILWENKDFEGEHRYFGPVVEKGEDIITINMYDQLKGDESSSVKMMFEIEDVIGQMYFVGNFEDLIRR